MTREEAIEILHFQTFVVDFQTGKALEMAISALRQQESKVTVTLPIWDMNLRSIVLKKLRGVEYQYTQMHSLMTENIADTICQGIEECLVQKERNDPLMLDELRKMDGEPVWVCFSGSIIYEDGWFIITETEKCEALLKGKASVYKDFECYGKTWLAYRQKPEGTV